MATSPLRIPARLLLALAAAVVLALTAGVAAPTPAVAATKDPRLAEKLTSVLSDSRVRTARTSVVVLDAADGSELYGRYAWRGTTPASNTKILTAAAAMKTLGPGYRFKTQVIIRATPANGVVHGYLYLKGYGDPTTVVSDYRSLARQVAARGITRVTGKLVADATFFDSDRYNANWSTSYQSDYYAAQISALTVAPNRDYDSGTVVVKYRPGAKKGSRAKIRISPASAASYVKIVNKMTTSASGSRGWVSVSRRNATNTITVSGRIPLGRSTQKEWVTVDKPELYAAAVFRSELAKVGVRIDGSSKIGATPTTRRRQVALDRSMPLSSLLVPFLKLSNNMHAEHLTKTMATLKGGRGNWSDGLKITMAYVRSTGAPMDGTRLVDGSGLSRANKITPRAMGRVLFAVQNESWFPAFYAALPVAANADRMVGGTLRSRMRGTRAAGNAHAKTGTLTGVTALSGYVRGRDGRRYVFAMLSEHSGASPRPVEDKLVVALANWRR
ncbi:D-alanyl-D-alanine carboxypeptidase/D-alanyl-D-alanine-endopeptidase [Microlunatus panaciterrae]|uniref:D-alanyl-D-alanine carboxypeptidase/D-alanyl-D-alanine-endopeptidase (Penicillin-binding protein 4) n=1 Tax=Microlunatus panaciterrae TaxID=400768 RepID=A0ABS2RG14_9ACTN|nr:D-alanyl-D-alanine carboxypeptidase/D-alanyl-D-alanine-endopeptidase [Microlunatus panaciterrae]MBM7797912.1 D-alanyl-D-alanine carboxypeptidase/D-alanyl-D-alanine-endopeptidase (penicillin-binding protein 4) [Microlunatus panaciterrae]